MKKVIGKYREFAKRINPQVKVRKGAEWCCYQGIEELEVPQLASDEGLQSFLDTIKKQLCKMNKLEVFDKYDDFIWCFLHEMGHLCKPKRYHDLIIRKLIDGMSLLGMEKTAKFFYYRLKEEKTATAWACQFVVDNPELVAKYNWELVKSYKRYFKSLGLTN